MKSKKIDKLIADAERLEEKGKFDKALKKYTEARDLDPERAGLEQKIITLHEKSLGEDDWRMEDFAEHIDLIMQQQEKEYPPIKQTHAKLTPEWKEASNLVMNILATDDEDAAGPLIEELVGKGEIATRTLIDLLRSMKRSTLEGEGDES